MNEAKIDQIDFTILETRRFIQRAYAWRKRLKTGDVRSKEGAAAKRASLDLSRSLAELRKP